MRGEDEAADVVLDVAGDGDGADEAFHGDDLFGVDDGDGRGGLHAGGAVEDGEEVSEFGAFDGDFEGEAIELGFGERSRCLPFREGFGCCQDEEGFGEFVGGFGDGDGLLGHGFQKRGLGFRGGAVDFVGEDEIAKDGAGLELEDAVAFVIIDDDGGADDVGGHEVRGELDAGELEVEDLGEGADETHGFAEAGDAFQQGMAADHQAEDGLCDDVFVADDDLGDFGFDGVVAGFEVSDLRFDVGGRDFGDRHQLLLKTRFWRRFETSIALNVSSSFLRARSRLSEIRLLTTLSNFTEIVSLLKTRFGSFLCLFRVPSIVGKPLPSAKRGTLFCFVDAVFI